MEMIFWFMTIATVMLLILSGLFMTGVGLLTMFHVFVRSKKSPMDSSNRINHLRLWWFVLTRPELFATTFPWLKNDEFDNIK